MGLDSSEVRVAGAGHVYMAPEGTTPPADIVTPVSEAWTDLGYVTTDGVGFTFSRETEDLDAWQGDKIRVLTVREPMSLNFSLMQSNADVMVAAMGGGTIDSPEQDVYRYTPAAGENLNRALLIEFSDGDITYRYIVYKAQVEGDVTYTLVRDGALTYPIEFGVLDSDPKYIILSDDPSMAVGTLPGTPGSGADPTGAIEGTPGSFTPPGCLIPADLTTLQGIGDLGQTDAWVTGNYVVLDDASFAHWDGGAWAVGTAPVVVAASASKSKK